MYQQFDYAEFWHSFIKLSLFIIFLFEFLQSAIRPCYLLLQSLQDVYLDVDLSLPFSHLEFNELWAQLEKHTLIFTQIYPSLTLVLIGFLSFTAHAFSSSLQSTKQVFHVLIAKFTLKFPKHSQFTKSLLSLITLFSCGQILPSLIKFSIPLFLFQVIEGSYGLNLA